MSFDALAAAAAEERQRAVSALLARHVVLAGEPEFVLVRRHREELSAAFRDHLGYTLTVIADTAHLAKRLSLAQARPLRLAPRSQSDRRRAIDDRKSLHTRVCQLVCLICAVLERRGWAQVPLGALAEDVLGHARSLDVEIDWRSFADRTGLADAVEQLSAAGVLALRSGRAGEIESEEEAFYDVHRRRLALLLVDPVRCAEARTAGDLEQPVREGGDLAGRARAQRILRALVEDPVVYLDDLAEDDRAYFLTQRARLERIAADLTGLQVERRREGTALVARGRELTDRPFPAQGAVKQLALLLLGRLCDRDHADGTTISAAEIARMARELVSCYAAHWPWDLKDCEAVSRAADEALEVLADLRLATVGEHGVRVLPAAHRYRGAAARTSMRRDQLELV